MARPKRVCRSVTMSSVTTSNILRNNVKQVHRNRYEKHRRETKTDCRHEVNGSVKNHRPNDNWWDVPVFGNIVIYVEWEGSGINDKVSSFRDSH